MTYLLRVCVDAGDEMLRNPDVAVVYLAGAAAAGEDILRGGNSDKIIRAQGEKCIKSKNRHLKINKEAAIKMAFLDLHTFLVSPLVPEVRLYLFLGEDIHYELRPNKNRVVEPFCTSSLTSLNVLRSFFRPFKENARTPRLCLYCRDDWEMSCRSLLQHKSAMRVISPQICFLYLTFRFMLTSHGKGSVGKENLPDSS